MRKTIGGVIAVITVAMAASGCQGGATATTRPVESSQPIPSPDGPKGTSDPAPPSVTTTASAPPPTGCPVAKDVLLRAVQNSEYGPRLAVPIELEDQIRCVDGWAMAFNGTHGNTRNRTEILYRYDYTAAGWKAVDIGSSIRCTDKGVPADIAGRICH